MMVAAAAVMIGTTLPWISAPIVGSMPGYRGDGIFALAAGAVALVVVLVGAAMDLSFSVQKWTAVLMGSVAVAIPAVKWYELELRINEVAGSDNPFSGAVSASVNVDVGLVVTLVGGILLVFLPFALSDEQG
jgi:hypothetical protein